MKKKSSKTKSAPTPLQKDYFDFLGDAALPHWEHACRVVGDIGKHLEAAQKKYNRLAAEHKKLINNGKGLTLPAVAKFCYNAQETAAKIVDDLEFAAKLADIFRESVGYPAFAANLIGFCDNLAKTDK